jgi:hypothetical protein
VIFLLLGAVHLVYIFFVPKLMPRQATTKRCMEQDELVLTRETTVWRAWVGFNASHSLGALFIGANTLILAVKHLALYTHSPGLQWLTIATSACFVWLAKQYWFRTPLVCLAIATGCFLAAWLVS